MRYHQHRLDVLAELKAEGLLSQWRVNDDEIGARTDSTQLTMNPDRVSLHPRGSLLAEEPLQLLRLAFRAAAPPRFHFHAAFQYLVGIENKTYDKARTDGLDRLSLGPVAGSDFALLLDGTRLDADWHGEFGIVSEEEVEPRIRRRVTEASRFGGAMPPFVDLPPDISPASFFADFVWFSKERQVPPDSGDAIDQLALDLARLGEGADEIVSQVHARLCEGSLLSMAEGSEP